MSSPATALNRILADIISQNPVPKGDSTRFDRSMQHALIHQALEQRVGVLCHQCIAQSAWKQKFDPDFLSQLRRHAVAESVLDAHRQECLREVLEALGEAGINTLVFKGAALALSHYPHSHLRPRDDSDLLLDRSHLPALSRVLLRLGFKHIASNQQSLIQHQCLFSKRDKNGCLYNIDVHWALSNRCAAGPSALTLAALRCRAQPLTALGNAALGPDPLDSVLIACVHMLTHHPGEIRLIWLYDLLLLVDSLSQGQQRQLGTALNNEELFAAGNLGLGLAAYYFPERSSALLKLVTQPLTPETWHPPRQWQMWQADMATLATTRQRLQYLGQHFFPSRHYMLSRSGQVSTLWLPWLYLQRAGRGVRHLLMR